MKYIVEMWAVAVAVLLIHSVTELKVISIPNDNRLVAQTKLK